MKRQTLKLLSILTLSIMLAASAVSASPGSRIKANIPFDFAVGNKTFRAGAYTVERTAMQGTLLIRSADCRASALTSNTIGVQAKERQGGAYLVFRRYGHQYFLAQVWDGVNDGRELLKSRLERETARQSSKHLARQHVEPEIVSVTAQ